MMYREPKLVGLWGLGPGLHVLWFRLLPSVGNLSIYARHVAPKYRILHTLVPSLVIPEWYKDQKPHIDMTARVGEEWPARSARPEGLGWVLYCMAGLSKYPYKTLYNPRGGSLSLG